MPVIKVWCLPAKQSEKQLEKLYRKILAAVASVRELKINEKSITVLFPPDQMRYGLGEEIIIEIGWFFQKKERTLKVRQRLCLVVASAVKMFYPKAKVECKVETFNPKKEAFCVLPAVARPIKKTKVLMCIDKIHECNPTGGPECAGCGG
jgi:phenylpyruvate tautomerase PptA (4-oxalocrotonate tautomerase family)